MKPTILTVSGKYVNLLYPDPATLDPMDIAHALSNVCRFAGHTRVFYSVAQHAVLTSYLVPPEHAWEALHHDDTEAYLGDVTTPLKQLLPDYRAIENNFNLAVRTRFNLSPAMDDEVRLADLRALAIECVELFPLEDPTNYWAVLKGIKIPKGAERLLRKILTPEEARIYWINRYCQLMPTSADATSNI